MANSNRKKRTATVTDKLLHPQLQIVKAIIRDLLAEYDSNEIKKMWNMICQES
jgi:hypothetical protein